MQKPNPYDVRRFVRVRFFLCVITTVLIDATNETSAEDHHKNALQSDRLHHAVQLLEPSLDESSGLAASNRVKGHWWSHNDSGGKPRLFAFNSKGDRTGKVDLSGIDATDWEDMASYQIDGKPMILAADCGDNLAKRDEIQLYLFDEPDPNASSKITGFRQLTVTYSDGPRNCEAVAVDPIAKKITLIEKAKLPIAGIYELDLPTPSTTNQKVVTRVVAQRIGTLNVPMISAMDRDSKNGDLWVINYFQAFHFPCGEAKDHRSMLRETPVAYDLPKWKQIEAVAVDAEHRVWLTSEGKFAPLGRLKINP